ncbi:hypothetical protein CQR50_1253 [Bifidobacterium pseudolongum subsp. globosum]|uniref:Uncharacterized protein n=1 Tax=Bifidobacterium pseudolongum subsp. globosum TaxID=1690 RepID=A0A2N3R4L4_9BIFI|nr:hypothetical protein CQR50_1253 [Bifidobacterium pseudolongum subsp. globosum]
MQWFAPRLAALCQTRYARTHQHVHEGWGGVQAQGKAPAIMVMER